MIRLHKLSKRTRRAIYRHWYYWIVTCKMKVYGTWVMTCPQFDLDDPEQAHLPTRWDGQINITIMGSGF